MSGKYIENSLIREKLRGFSNALNMIICDDYDKKVDGFSEIDKNENEKSYVGIFVEKECGYLSKNIMQFGADMKIVWPDNVKNEVVNRLKGMLSLYEYDNR